VLYLVVGQVLCRAKHTEASIGHHHVNALVIGEGLLDYATHLHGVSGIKLAHPEAVESLGGEVIQRFRRVQCCCDFGSCERVLARSVHGQGHAMHQ
jgi:hypothetical protein